MLLGGETYLTRATMVVVVVENLRGSKVTKLRESTLQMMGEYNTEARYEKHGSEGQNRRGRRVEHVSMLTALHMILEG